MVAFRPSVSRRHDERLSPHVVPPAQRPPCEVEREIESGAHGAVGGGGERGCTKAIGTVARECNGYGTSEAWSLNDFGCELSM